jgi:hypothetical protein
VTLGFNLQYTADPKTAGDSEARTYPEQVLRDFLDALLLAYLEKEEQYGFQG